MVFPPYNIFVKIVYQNLFLNINNCFIRRLGYFFIERFIMLKTKKARNSPISISHFLKMRLYETITLQKMMHLL